MSLNNQNITGADELVAKLRAAQEYVQKDVPEIIGIEAVKHFKKSFNDGGFTDTSLKKWTPRKTKRTGSTNGQKTLVKSSELMDSIDYRVQGNLVIIYSDKLYAQIHNEGGTVTITPQMKKFFWAKNYEAEKAGDFDLAEEYKFMALAKEIKIEQRMFIGNSEVMNTKILEKVNRDLTRILK
ncbi:MAG: phage virion morphogenesis protein [Bacteroidetes bacterium]|nr:phage virion morphogenesis protein [Bacteroidota bacterium]